MDDRRIARNKRMREEYRKEHASGLRHEIIVQKLVPKYCLAELTIDAIIFEKGAYKEN